MNAKINLDSALLGDFCNKWQICELSLFGSALREDFNSESDLDFLVSFGPDASWSLWDMVEMRDELATLTGRQVDLVEKEGLRNPYRSREILESKEVIYAA
jgi:uncharacterized protein